MFFHFGYFKYNTKPDSQKNQAEPKPDEDPSVQMWLLKETQVSYQTWSQNQSHKADDILTSQVALNLFW